MRTPSTTAGVQLLPYCRQYVAAQGFIYDVRYRDVKTVRQRHAAQRGTGRWASLLHLMDFPWPEHLPAPVSQGQFVCALRSFVADSDVLTATKALSRLGFEVMQLHVIPTVEAEERFLESLHPTSARTRWPDLQDGAA